MNAKRQTSLMLLAWGCAVGLPASLADAHGNNPKYGVEEDTLDQPPEPPPHADWSPKVRSMLEDGHSVVSNRGGGVLPGLPDLRSDIDSPFEFEEIDLTQDPSNALRAMLLPPGPAPYAGPESPDLVGLLPEAELSAAQLPGIPGNGAVPAPGTLAILGLAAAIAGRRRRRHN